MNHFDRTYVVDVRAYLLVIYALAEPHMIDKIDKYTKAVASYAARDWIRGGGAGEMFCACL